MLKLFSYKNYDDGTFVTDNIVFKEKYAGLESGVDVYNGHFKQEIGDKRYQLSNHLGNVLEVITDRKLRVQEQAPALYENDFSSTDAPFTAYGGSTNISGQTYNIVDMPLWGTASFTETTEVGHVYEVSFDADLHGATNVRAYARESNYVTAAQLVLTANGTYSYQFTAQTSSVTFIWQNEDSGNSPRDLSLDNVIVREINALGNYFLADVVNYSDYYPFGMEMPGRHERDESYRYGYQGQEKDDEIKGEGNSYTAEFWQYDSRLGKRWNSDPVVKAYESPYAAFANNPIICIDPQGSDNLSFNINQELEFMDGGDNDVIIVDRIVYEGSINTLENPEAALQEFYTWRDGLSPDEIEQLFQNGERGIALNNDGLITVYSREKFNVSGFKDFLGTVAGESSSDVQEAEGIGAVIINRLSYTGNDLNESGMSAIDGGIVARPGRTWNEVTGASLEEIANYSQDGYGARIQGAFQAVQNYPRTDASVGAYFWENNRSYSNPNNYFYRMVSNGTFVETMIIGGSTFFKYNPQNQIYGRNVWP